MGKSEKKIKERKEISAWQQKIGESENQKEESEKSAGNQL